MTKKNISVKKVLKITSMTLLILVAVTILVGWLVGYKAFIVNGASMEPIIHYRSLAIDYKPAAQNIEIGDAVTYKVGNGFITHRLIRVRTVENLVLAEFRDFANYEASWEEGGAYYVERYDLGVNVVAWYSGIDFTETSIFTTQGTNYSKNPFDSTASLETVTYPQIYGIVIFSIPNFGNVVLFIQGNIILIIATFAALILLYNMVSNEIRDNKTKQEQQNKKNEEDK